jgi:rare lipoprotein A
MLKSKKLAPGNLTRSRTALAVFAATLFVGGTATEASAKSRHHHNHHAYRDHHARHLGNGADRASAWAQPKRETARVSWGNAGRASSPDPFRNSWRDAQAAFTSGSGLGRIFSGMASYYGNESGRKTASGARFDQNAMTCAHRSLPFGTKLRVTHGSRSVIVTVNDRGPFVRGRVLDLSTGAARAVGLTGAGVGRVTAEVIS